MHTLTILIAFLYYVGAQNFICISGQGISVFNEGTRQNCESIRSLTYQNALGKDVSINVTHIIMNGNPGVVNNESAVYNLTVALLGSLPRYDFFPIVGQTLSRARDGWFEAASLKKDSYFINLRASPLETVLPPNNTVWNIFNEFAVWFIKGFLASHINSTNRHHVLVIAENYTATYVNNANAYLAGILHDNPKGILYVIDTAGNFGNNGNEQLVMNRIKSIETQSSIYFPIIAHMQSQKNWPPILAAENRLGIENQVEVENLQTTKDALIGPTQPHILITTQWNHNILYRELIPKGIGRGLAERETRYITKNEEDQLVIDISEMSDVVPNELQKKVRELRKKYLVKDHKNNILCDPSAFDVLRDAYLIINDCIQTDSIVYRTKLSDKIIHLSAYNN